MKIIDAHVHVFPNMQGFRGEGELYPLGNGKGRWANGDVVQMIPEGLGDIGFTYETCHDFLKENGVEKAVILQGSYYGFANEYVSEAVKTYPEMFIGAGTFDPMTRYAEKIYDRLTQELEFPIIKFETSTGGGFMSYHHTFDIEEVFTPFAKKCEKHSQVLVLDIGSPGMSSFQPEAVRNLALKFTGLKIVVCHLLAPTLEEKKTDCFKKSMEKLALPNIWFDLAAVPFNVQPEEYPFASGLEFMKTAKNIVGADKLMWGTDIPSVLVQNSYQKLRDYITEKDVFTTEELDGIYYKNALEVYPFSHR